jgi:hypothetical protein
MIRHGAGAKGAVPQLAEVVTGRDPEMAGFALAALAAIGTEAAAAEPALMKALATNAKRFARPQPSLSA